MCCARMIHLKGGWTVNGLWWSFCISVSMCIHTSLCVSPTLILLVINLHFTEMLVILLLFQFSIITTAAFHIKKPSPCTCWYLLIPCQAPGEQSLSYKITSSHLDSSISNYAKPILSSFFMLHLLFLLNSATIFFPFTCPLFRCPPIHSVPP